MTMDERDLGYTTASMTWTEATRLVLKCSSDVHVTDVHVIGIKNHADSKAQEHGRHPYRLRIKQALERRRLGAG